MLTALAVSLILTLAIEEVFAIIWGLRRWRELCLVVLVNCLTNPPVVLLYHMTVGTYGWNRVLVTLVLETAAILIEWRYYRNCSEQIKKPLLFSILANMFSYGIGCLINLFL